MYFGTQLRNNHYNLVSSRAHGAHDEGVADVFEEDRADAEDDVGQGDDHEEDKPKPNN
jgi:hypothetical protein